MVEPGRRQAAPHGWDGSPGQAKKASTTAGIAGAGSLKRASAPADQASRAGPLWAASRCGY